VLSASDLDRIRAALDKADNGDPAQADADLLPAPTASGPGVATDETLAPPEAAAQPAPATAAGPEAADAVPADAKLVPAQRPPAEQQPDHRDGQTASPPGQQTAGPVPAPRENGQASPPQAPAHRGNGHASPEQVALPQRKRQASRGKVALPPGNGQAAPEQPAVPQGNGQASLGKVRARPAPAPARPPKSVPPPKAPVTPAGPSRPRGRGRTSRVVIGGAIVVLFLLSAGSAFLLTRQEGVPASRSADSQVAIRDRAAAWVASQVSRASLVSCDQVMCRALEAHRVPAADLLVLRPGAADPLRSSVVVVTAAVTRMVGSGPLDEDAPATLASFGSGDKRISIRMIFAQGAAAYASALRAGLAARKANESWLLNPRITMSAAARQQLATGQVDSRLVLTIANLAFVWPVRILTFGDQAPGASAGIPLRCAEVMVTGGRAAADLAGQARLMSGYVHGLEDFYAGARIQVVRLTGGREAVQIGFTAPSPLGWVSTASS